MIRFSLSSLVSAGAAVLVFLAAPASAQDRPSLERLEAYSCEAAEARGDTYRPSFCTPECPCSIPGTLVTCEQTAADAYLAYSTPAYSCVPEHEMCELLLEFNLGCSSSSQAACSLLSPSCPAGESCYATNNGIGFCSISTGEACGIPGLPECPQGETCDSPDTGLCFISCDFQGVPDPACPLTGNNVCDGGLGTPCTTALDCAVDKVTLGNVGAAEAVAAASCQVDLLGGSTSTVPISSSDALECVSQIEALTGACQAAP